MPKSDHAQRLHAYLDEVCETLPRWWTVRPYRDTWRPRSGTSLAVGVALAFLQCGGQTDNESASSRGGASSGGSAGSSGSSPSAGTGGAVAPGGSSGVSGVAAVPPGTTEQNCFDAIDNDQDGATDCGDEDCRREYPYVCTEEEVGEEHCWDSVDNDGSGYRDCADWQCRDWCMPSRETRCFSSDGGDWWGDEDGDGLYDCADPDCAAICQNPDLELDCYDGEDNDGDGLYDQDDPDCELVRCAFGSDYAGIVLCENCDDGRDDDGDGLTDCDDPNCVDHPACTGIEDCFSGLDLDGDGLAQCDDPDCAGEYGETLCPVTYTLYGMPFLSESDCADGIDEDADSLTDCADPDCATSPACTGTPTESAPITLSYRQERV